ncbi:hypothetical protein EHI45_23940 [Rhizobium leguminosarum]|nr:hypothetical protein EHI45_23940 [Rhizobium leguminosarum]
MYVCLTIQVRIRRYPQRDKVVRKWTELVQPETAGESGKTNDGKILVVVADTTGPGVDTPKVDQIFDAFFTTKPDGLGMGLSICRSIIEAHGGMDVAERSRWKRVLVHAESHRLTGSISRMMEASLVATRSRPASFARRMAVMQVSCRSSLDFTYGSTG